MSSAKRLNQTLRNFIEEQPVFFVATAAQDGRVNVSPKGLDTLRVIGDNKILWLNLTGSGNETAAHLRELSRMTLMFCAFNANARILRVYGSARTVHPGDREWADLASHFPVMAGQRQIFELDIDLVQLSCGSGVPVMSFDQQRGTSELLPYYEDMGPHGVRAFWDRKNAVSVDGKNTGI